MIFIKEGEKKDMKIYNEFNPTEFNTYVDTRSKKDKDYEFECDDILTLDIETTSAWIKDDGEIIPYHPNEDEGYWNTKTPISLCYIWQFSFNETVYYGRDFKDFLKVLDKLPKNIHFIIWVHNLGFEFEFLQNILNWKDVFARDAHKMMKATSYEYPNIEFRCTLFLTRLSLASWGKKIGLPKMVGDLDYVKIRTPKTKLTDTELGYCARDCEVVYQGILKYREKYCHLCKIPLTQTGEVRKVLKDKLRKDASAQRKIISLIPENALMYEHMVDTFAGGYTHANYINSGIAFTKDMLPKGYGVAYDFCSSYPTVMCCKKFPMTPFIPDTYDKNKVNEFAYMMKVNFVDVEAKTYNHYLSYSKAFDIEKDGKGKDDVVLDNGRIIKAKGFSMWLTELDLDIIRKTYNGKMKILECYSSRKGYLPKPIIMAVLEFYNNKTQYKDVKGYDDIYAQSKQYLNSIFGCCVQRVVPDDIVYKDGNWTKILANSQKIQDELTDLRNNNKGRSYCAYQWGVWITAYGRHNLWKCMLYKDGKRSVDEDVIYCDTDSLKILDEYDFSWYNKEVDKEMKEMCDYYNIDFELTRPKDPKGIKHPLGYFEREQDWIEFKTLGAKRYVYRTTDGKLHLTVSGINKDAVDCLDDDIDNFDDDFEFDKDSESVTKKFIIHTTSQPDVIWQDGKYDEWKSNDRYGIVMRNTGYKLGVADEYAFLIGLSNV